jgi:hypothetical protein
MLLINTIYLDLDLMDGSQYDATNQAGWRASPLYASLFHTL